MTDLSGKQKQTIRKRVQRAIKRGLIVRPSRCEQCGSDNNQQVLDAHHEDYSKPLEVVFLCRECHGKVPKPRNVESRPTIKIYVIERKIHFEYTPVKIRVVYTRDRIIENGKEYTRDTHPLLFAVVDWLEITPHHRQSSVRKIAAEFEASTGRGVSKSWAAVAKNYWLSQAST
jgi:hypothetical protein